MEEVESFYEGCSGGERSPQLAVGFEEVDAFGFLHSWG